RPQVAERSEAFLVTISRSRSYMNLIACSRSIFAFLDPQVPRSAGKVVLVGGLASRLGRGDDVAPHQFLQVLVEGLHAVLLPRLDGGVHLRDLVLADEVADRRRADHDLVRGDPASAVLGLA